MTEPVLIIPDWMPACRSLGNGRWQTLESWNFSIDSFTTIIPSGFVTDLYSSPWTVRPFIPQDEPDNRPALVHDWLFATVGLRGTRMDEPRVSRERSNLALLVSMRDCRFSWWRRTAIYRGVWMGSRPIWQRLADKGYSLANPCLS